MAVQAAGDNHPLLAAARALGPAIRERADRIERPGRLRPELVRELSEAGIVRMLVPRALGGGEVDPVTQIHVLDALLAPVSGSGLQAQAGSRPEQVT